MMDLHRFNSLKILVHSDRLRAIAVGEWPYPLDWHIYPSNKCNHACVWCMFRQNGEQFDNPVKLSASVLLRAIRDAADTGATLVHFSGGGEPLLHHHTLEAMVLAQSRGLAVALSTNGRLLTPEVAAQVDYLRVSVNAGTKRQHDLTNHMGLGSDWKCIIDALRHSLPHRRKDAGLSFVVDAENWCDIMSFCQLAAELQVDFVHIRPAFWYSEEKDRELHALMPTILATCNDARQAYGDVVQIYAITEKFDGYWSPRTYDRCRAVLTGACLTATGDFAVCQDRTDLRFGRGYRDGQEFRRIWGGPEHRRVVKAIAGEELDRCPRCVWNRRNEIIEHVFNRDSMRLAMI